MSLFTDVPKLAVKWNVSVRTVRRVIVDAGLGEGHRFRGPAARRRMIFTEAEVAQMEAYRLTLNPVTYTAKAIKVQSKPS